MGHSYWVKNQVNPNRKQEEFPKTELEKVKQWHEWREHEQLDWPLLQDPKDEDARLQVGNIYGRNGATDVALKEFETILAGNPRNAAALNNRGNLYYDRGDYEHALESYRFAEEVDAGDGGIRVNVALAYYRLGKLAEAQAKYREATRLQKDLGNQYRSLARLLGN